VLHQTSYSIEHPEIIGTPSQFLKTIKLSPTEKGFIIDLMP
jgi:hypothetical protein